MSLNFKQPGSVLTLTAPQGGVVGGMGYIIGGLFAVATSSADAGAQFDGVVAGVLVLPKATGQAWTEGQRVYWDAGNQRCDTLQATGQPIGAATATAASGDISGPVRLGWVPAATITPEGGIAVWMVNKTGGATVKGQLVTSGGATARGFVLVTAGIPNCIGAVYDVGVAADGLCRVVVTGAAEVLFADGQGPTVGYWAGSSAAVNGRAETRATVPDNSGSGIDIHNREIGHVLETKASGTDVLALCVLHFN